ncbi:hypothetical protein [Bradyrhizobium sp. CCGUVB14]|uniref:hypothetical protein n=1 Tax=Bradyrhizobium sp. CCGUVB14 TaxID=2949628 RepID=UPI0020B424E1|nr:hypothetical protein [Bradyrhizobium sp. CCGUVB14]MCP3441984.1 hypothetical protein [Bradyrhizobium sp. CCGUVB14]
MPDQNAIQERLVEHYEKWKSEFNRGSLVCKDFSPPLLIAATSSYASARAPTLIFGQETFGWSWNGDLRRQFPVYSNDYEFENQNSLEDFLTKPDAVKALCWGYEQFALGETQSMRTPFWRAFRRISQAGNALWSNVAKCDYQGGSILQLNPSHRSYFFEQQASLVRGEIEVLSPKVVILFTGPYYDDFLRGIFPGLVFEPALDSGTAVSKLSHPTLPAETFRTYHPNYLSRSGKLQYIEAFASIVKQSEEAESGG